MSTRYLMGIDAGATKTAYALYDSQTRITRLHYAGCGNHERLAGGYDELRKMMTAQIGQLCQAAGIAPEDIGGAGLGIAGVDTARQHRIISDIFAGIGLKQFHLGNDALLGIKAECETGICAVNGTGFSILGIDDQGNTAQMGGLDELTGDQGGGRFYAERGIEAVYRALEKEGPKTRLTEGTLRLLGIDDGALFIEALSEANEGAGQGDFRKGISILVHTCAAEGDAVAEEILRSSGREYAACVLGVLRHLPRLAAKGEVNLILVGSCFLRSASDLTKRTMEQVLREKRPEVAFRIRPIQTDPVVGGLLWAREAAQIDLSREEILGSYQKAIIA